MPQKPYFLITIDTEGDNLWANPKEVSTKNASFLFRFQELCEKYSMKPTYLTNYEMANDDVFKKLGLDIIQRNAGEIGMHLHAWDMPPHSYQLTENDMLYHPYLIEYPYEIMQQKVKLMTDCLENNFGIKMRSHRAGRWSFDERYAQLLVENGYQVDCSVTPFVSWRYDKGNPKQSGGTDFTHFPNSPYFINLNDISSSGQSTLLEVPVTIEDTYGWANRLAFMFQKFNLIRRGIMYLFPKKWLRPNGRNLNNMKSLLQHCIHNNHMYVEFMLHSSELMPGGSPKFKNELTIQKLYQDLEILFNEANRNFVGCTLSEFYQAFLGMNKNATV
jgi:hypothetical protein